MICVDACIVVYVQTEAYDALMEWRDSRFPSIHMAEISSGAGHRRTLVGQEAVVDKVPNPFP